MTSAWKSVLCGHAIRRGKHIATLSWDADSVANPCAANLYCKGVGREMEGARKGQARVYSAEVGYIKSCPNICTSNGTCCLRRRRDYAILALFNGEK